MPLSQSWSFSKSLLAATVVIALRSSYDTVGTKYYIQKTSVSWRFEGLELKTRFHTYNYKNLLCTMRHNVFFGVFLCYVHHRLADGTQHSTAVQWGGGGGGGNRLAPHLTESYARGGVDWSVESHAVLSPILDHRDVRGGRACHAQALVDLHRFWCHRRVGNGWMGFD